MACVIQMQRRAIEELRPVKGNLLVKGFLGNNLGRVSRRKIPIKFALEESFPLYFLGVSEGFGTCSDIHGINVIVLSLIPPGNLLTESEWRKVIGAEYTVLLSEVEGSVKRILELLALENIDLSANPVAVTFRRTRKTSSYVQLV